MMTKNFVTSMSVVSLLAISGLSADVASAEWRALAIRACVQGTASGQLSHAWDGLYNASPNQFMQLDCSVPSTTGTLNNLKVLVIGGGIGPVRCEMWVVTANGTVSHTGGPKLSSGYGIQELTWTYSSSLPPPYIRCSLPPLGIGTQMAGVAEVISSPVY